MNLTESCEIALARSALPQRLRAEASVYVLSGDRYRRAIESEGAFTCIVERNHPASLIPQCMDRAGLDSVLPAIIDRGEMAAAGIDPATIESTSHARLQAGDYRPATRPGISYMMSDFTYTWVPSAQQLLKVAPHVMYYAPNLTNTDVGGSLRSMTENLGTPFVFHEGPHGYMIVYTEHRADPNEVAEACRGQLGEPPPPFDPFPKG